MPIELDRQEPIPLTIDQIHQIPIPNGIILGIQVIIIERKKPGDIPIMGPHQSDPAIITLRVQIQFFLRTHNIHVKVKLHRIRYLLKTPKGQNLERTHRRFVSFRVAQEEFEGAEVGLGVFERDGEELAAIDMFESDLVAETDDLVGFDLAALEAADVHAGQLEERVVEVGGGLGGLLLDDVDVFLVESEVMRGGTCGRSRTVGCAVWGRSCRSARCASIALVVLGDSLKI